MNEFNIGDEVRVIEVERVDVECGFSEGDVLTITYVDPDDEYCPYNAGGHWFYPYQLELVLPTLENE